MYDISSILFALLFALSANIDSFILGLSLGLKNTKTAFGTNMLIGFITMCGTAAALFLGEQALRFLPLSVTQRTGNLILILLGCFYVFQSLRHSKYSAKKESDSSSAHMLPPVLPLPVKTACLHGLALSVNNFGIGIGAGISGLSFLPTVFCSLLFSAAFFSVGNRLGLRWITGTDKRIGDFLCGCILILLGILEWLL